MLLSRNKDKWRLHRYNRGCVITHVTRPVRDRIRAISSMLLVGFLFVVVFSLFCVFRGVQLRTYASLCLYCVIPGLLLAIAFDLWAFGPAVLHVDHRSDTVMSGDRRLRFSLSHCRVYVDQKEGAEQYKVYVSDVWGSWQCLVWETTTHAEAVAVVDELGHQGLQRMGTDKAD